MAMIHLPNDWTPRGYQIEPFAALDSGIKRVITVWHRRSGKDSCAINYAAKALHSRVGNYWHLFPNARQGRKALWEAVDKLGRRVIDQAFPLALRESTRNDEMIIRFKNGSTWQVTGADQSDSLIGANPVGVVFSEYAITSPLTWRFVEPILMENEGWAWFNSTPRGKNHLYSLYETNKNNPAWFCSVKGWQDTGVITQSDIDAVILSGMPAEIAEQEFGCSFNAPNIGIVYARQLEELKRRGQITSVPYDPRYPVSTSWDIGHRDATAIWFYQRIASRINVIDFLTDRGKGLPHYANEIAKKPYSYSRHVGPHDLEQKVWATDATTKSSAEKFGIHFFVAPKTSIADGISTTRMFLPRCHFDAIKCADGLAALEQYQYEYDEDTRMFGDKPVHDWSSHPADAIRYEAVTPEGLGSMPTWMNEGRRGYNHNGGPPLDDAPFDPLAEWKTRY